MSRPPSIPTCGHPDRENYDKGQCRSCAGADGARVPTCGHPGRKHFGKDMCKPCYITAWNKAHPEANTAAGWKKRNPEAAALYKRRFALKRHGLTVEHYAEMWNSQGGICANPRCDFTAEVSIPDHRKGLQVDHDHETGEVRGLLCPGCNLALGCVQDDQRRLLGLVEYLRR